jgi:hypothetical protein
MAKRRLKKNEDNLEERPVGPTSPHRPGESHGLSKVASSANEADLDELGSDPGQVGPDSAGQSGDAQGLSAAEDANEEAVEELAETEQAYEAEIVEGVEDVDDHPERPVHTHEHKAKSDDFPSNRDETDEPE